jgi:hypothetical protein
MRLALVALALALPAASSAEAPAPAKAAAKAAVPGRICPDDMRARDARAAPAPRLSRLGELPPGSLTLTVVNQVGDCIEPLTVRQGYGAFGPGR